MKEPLDPSDRGPQRSARHGGPSREPVTQVLREERKPIQKFPENPNPHRSHARRPPPDPAKPAIPFADTAETVAPQTAVPTAVIAGWRAASTPVRGVRTKGHRARPAHRSAPVPAVRDGRRGRLERTASDRPSKGRGDQSVANHTQPRPPEHGPDESRPLGSRPPGRSARARSNGRRAPASRPGWHSTPPHDRPWNRPPPTPARAKLPRTVSRDDWHPRQDQAMSQSLVVMRACHKRIKPVPGNARRVRSTTTASRLFENVTRHLQSRNRISPRLSGGRGSIPCLVTETGTRNVSNLESHRSTGKHNPREGNWSGVLPPNQTQTRSERNHNEKLLANWLVAF